MVWFAGIPLCRFVGKVFERLMLGMDFGFVKWKSPGWAAGAFNLLSTSIIPE
jgi:hypothetical protein